MARFDLYANPNPRAVHPFLLDVQSDLVTTATRWCVPLKPADNVPLMQRAQALVEVGGMPHVVDAPNLLAVPRALLRQPAGRLAAGEQALVEGCLDFLLRGW